MIKKAQFFWPEFFKISFVFIVSGMLVMNTRADIVYVNSGATQDKFLITFNGSSFNLSTSDTQSSLIWESTLLGGFNSDTLYNTTTNAVSSGSLINSSSSFTTSVDPNTNSAINQVYYGIRKENGTGHYNYGWIKISAPADPAYDQFNVTLNAIAFESTVDLGIHAGDTGVAVPEPGTLALFSLAGGAAAFAAIRKRMIARKSMQGPAIAAV